MTTKEREPMSSFCAYTSYLKEKLERSLTEGEYKVIMKYYIVGTPVEDVLEEMK